MRSANQRYIFEDGKLERMLTENGYVKDDIQYFYFKDYQGNNRAIADSNGNIGDLTAYYPYGTPFGAFSGNDPYKYSGKELDTMNGLNLYDFAARQQDPTLGIFTSQDPLAGDYPAISPYAYCAANPVLFTDPTGMVVTAFDEESRRNIINTLSEEEAKYVSFNSDGTISIQDIPETETSENFKSLSTLSSSDINYVFVTRNVDSEGKNFDGEEKNNGYFGVTSVPNGEQRPSPDNNVYVYTSKKLSEQRQAENLAHEGYGHTFLFEKSRTNLSIDPWHRYSNKVEKVWVPELNMYEWSTVFRPTNSTLEMRIKRAVNQVKKNYLNK